MFLNHMKTRSVLSKNAGYFRFLAAEASMLPGIIQEITTE